MSSLFVWLFFLLFSNPNIFSIFRQGPAKSFRYTVIETQPSLLKTWQNGKKLFSLKLVFPKIRGVAQIVARRLAVRAGPSSNLGSALQRGPFTERKQWGLQEWYSTSRLLYVCSINVKNKLKEWQRITKPWKYLIPSRQGDFLRFILFTFFNTTHLSPLRFQCDGGCWDQTQDCRTRQDLIHTNAVSLKELSFKWKRQQDFNKTGKQREDIGFGKIEEKAVKYFHDGRCWSF